METLLRVASYNIRKAVGLDWRRNSYRITKVLDEIDADIILLQEADKRLGARQGVFDTQELQDNLGYQFASVATNDVSHGWHGNAIIFKNTFTEIESERIALSQKEPRGAVSVSLQHKNGLLVECVGVHLALTQATRLKQISEIRSHLDSRPRQSPQIIAGDFNNWRRTKNVELAFGSEYRVISPGPSFHTARPRLSLDYIVTSNDVEVKNSSVHHTDLSRKASDHFPIYADLIIRKNRPTD